MLGGSPALPRPAPRPFLPAAGAEAELQAADPAYKGGIYYIYISKGLHKQGYVSKDNKNNDLLGVHVLLLDPGVGGVG